MENKGALKYIEYRSTPNDREHPPSQPKRPSTQRTYFGAIVTHNTLDRLGGDEVMEAAVQRQGVALWTKGGEGSHAQSNREAYGKEAKCEALTHTAAGMLRDRLSKVSYLRGLWKGKNPWGSDQTSLNGGPKQPTFLSPSRGS